MGDLAAVAERLRLVRAAGRKFLRLWTIEQAMVEPLIDRVEADLATVPGGDEPECHESPHGDAPQADKG